MKQLSLISDKFTESVIREMTRISDSMGGYNLSQGFPDFDSPTEIKDAAIAAINNNFNQYPVTFGEPDLREIISRKAASYNSINCNPETDITVTCGATEAMICSLKAIINPGDEVIVFEPFYENYGPDTILSGAKPKYVTLYAPDWKYDLDELKNAFNNKTKAIIINTPNNPTGKVFSYNELKEIADLCINYDTYAITDEIYEHIIYENIKHISLASLPGMADRTITINSISKTYSVTGWRLGWAIAPSFITSRIRKIHDFLTVGAPTPFQYAAVAALNFPKQYYVNLQSRYFEARKTLCDALRDAGFIPYLPKGAYYILANYSDLKSFIGSENDLEFAKKLILKTGIASVPGSSFYSSKKVSNMVRFAFCKKLETLNIAKTKLLDIRNEKNSKFIS
jgi:aspartate/methionine/tyrosine aminotransferase